MVTKKKNNETYLVVDYAQRNVVHMSALTEKTFEKFPDILDHVKDFDLSKSILFTILDNHKHKTVDWLLKFSNETERAYWLNVFSPLPAEKISTNDENQEKEIQIIPQKPSEDTVKKGMYKPGYIENRVTNDRDNFEFPALLSFKRGNLE